MSITNTARALLSEDTVALIEAGFLSEDLRITTDGEYYLRHLVFMDKMDALVARAKEKVAENKAKTNVSAVKPS